MPIRIDAKLGTRGIFDAIVAALEKGANVWPQTLADAAAYAGDVVVSQAKKTSLFEDRTANLRQSIQSRASKSKDGATVVVFPGMMYGEYVHEGTRDMSRVSAGRRARPYNPTASPQGVPGDSTLGYLAARSDKRYIFPLTARALRWINDQGEVVFSAYTRKGYRKPRPFLTEALERSQGEIAPVFADAVDLFLARIGM